MADQESVNAVRREMGLNEKAQTAVVSGLETLKSKTGDTKAFSEELKKMLNDAQLSQMSELSANTQQSIGQLVIGVAREMDKVKGVLSRLDSFTDSENEIMERATNAYAQAESVLQRAKEAITKKNWFNKWFVDFEGNIKNAEVALEAAKKLIPLAKTEAENLRSARQQNAQSEENVASLRSYSEAAIEVLEELFNENIAKITSSMNQRATDQKNFETSETSLKKLRIDTQKLENKIAKEQSELDGLLPEEVAAKKGKISALQIELEKLRSEEREALALYTSSEKLTIEHLIQIKGAEMTNAVIRSLQTTIKTETASRIISFEMALQQIKNGQALRVASSMNDANNALALKFGQVNLQVMASAAKDFERRLEEHPEIVAKEEAMLDEALLMTNKLKTNIENFRTAREKVSKARPRKSDFKEVKEDETPTE